MPHYTHLGGMFWKSDGAVFCEWQPLKLDPRRVKIYYGAWATDGKRVYWNTFWQRKIDAASFVALNGWYAKDAAAGFCGYSTVLKSAEVSTLEVLDSGQEKLVYGLGRNFDAGFARDRSQVFFDGFVVNKADPASFVSLGNCYGRDSTSVFYARFRLNGAIPLRWRYLGGRYSRDDERAFFENRAIKNVRIEHLVQIDPFDSEFAYDGRTIFYRGEPTTPDYYVECIRASVRCETRLVELVESGDWQRYARKSEWHYDAPDEVLQAFKTVTLGDPLSKVEKLFGQGESIPREHWDFFFPPLDRIIRPGFLEGAGTAPWSGASSQTPAGCQLRRWNHPEQVLICSFLAEKVIAKAILESDYATPPDLGAADVREALQGEV